MQVAANSFGRVCCQGFPKDNYSSTYKFQRKNHALVLRRNRIIECGIAEPSGEPAPMGQKTRYNDNLFDKAFMALFARKMNNIAGGKRTGNVDGYERFVETSRSVMQGRTPKQQQEAVRQVLLSILPPGAPERFRKLFPPTKWSAEFNAALTTPFFHWLVGPSEIGPKPLHSFPVGYFDGAAQLTIGGAGFMIYLSETHYFSFSVGCGPSSNTRAELLALWSILLVSFLMGIPIQRIFGDSMVIISWVNGQSTLEIASLKHWCDDIFLLRQLIPSVSINHVYREHNMLADDLSKKALNLEAGSGQFFENLDGKVIDDGQFTLF